MGPRGARRGMAGGPRGDVRTSSTEVEEVSFWSEEEKKSQIGSAIIAFKEVVVSSLGRGLLIIRFKIANRSL